MPTSEDTRLIRSIEARGALGGLYICEASENLLKESPEKVVRNGVDEINSFTDLLKMRNMKSAIVDLRRKFTPDDLMTWLDVLKDMDEHVIHVIGYTEWANKSMVVSQGESTTFGEMLETLNPPKEKGVHFLLWMTEKEIHAFLLSDTRNNPNLLVRSRQGIYSLASMSRHDVLNDGLSQPLSKLPKMRILRPK